jgi:hypothetical protein
MQVKAFICKSSNLRTFTPLAGLLVLEVTPPPNFAKHILYNILFIRLLANDSNFVIPQSSGPTLNLSPYPEPNGDLISGSPDPSPRFNTTKTWVRAFYD